MPPGPPDTRVSLILRLQDAGDDRAWDEFVSVYAPIVFRLARRRGLQASDADDLVQEVLASVARSVAAWLERDDRGPFRGWLLRIARNTAVDFLTRRKHRPLSPGGSHAQQALVNTEADEDLSDTFTAEYRREVFHWAAEQVQQLVANSTWEAFWRTAVLDEPIESVAEELRLSVGAVYIARSRVMKRLQQLVRQFEESDDDAV